MISPGEGGWFDVAEPPGSNSIIYMCIQTHTEEACDGVCTCAQIFPCVATSVVGSRMASSFVRIDLLQYCHSVVSQGLEPTVSEDRTWYPQSTGHCFWSVQDPWDFLGCNQPHHTALATCPVLCLLIVVGSQKVMVWMGEGWMRFYSQ